MTTAEDAQASKPQNDDSIATALLQDVTALVQNLEQYPILDSRFREGAKVLLDMSLRDLKELTHLIQQAKEFMSNPHYRAIFNSAATKHTLHPLDYAILALEERNAFILIRDSITRSSAKFLEFSTETEKSINFKVAELKKPVPASAKVATP